VVHVHKPCRQHSPLREVESSILCPSSAPCSDDGYVFLASSGTHTRCPVYVDLERKASLLADLLDREAKAKALAYCIKHDLL